MWNSGKGWEKTVLMPSCVTYVTEEHLVFVKWALTHLTVDVVKTSSGEGGDNGGNRGLGKARMGLK